MSRSPFTYDLGEFYIGRRALLPQERALMGGGIGGEGGGGEEGGCGKDDSPRDSPFGGSRRGRPRRLGMCAEIISPRSRCT